VVDVVFAPAPLPEAARRAQALGFAHIDVPCDWEGDLALPVGDRMAHPSPRPHCSCPAPPEAEGMWERAVRAYRRTPGVRMEPWPGSIVSSVTAVKAMLAMAIRACRKHGKYVGICGQGPSDHPDLARWLMEQGIDSLSLNPDTVVSTWLSLAEAAPQKKSAAA